MSRKVNRKVEQKQNLSSLFPFRRILKIDTGRKIP